MGVLDVRNEVCTVFILVNMELFGIYIPRLNSQFKMAVECV
jgi:hypothetical protein